MTQVPDEAALDERFVTIEELIAAHPIGAGDPSQKGRVRRGRHRAATSRLRLRTTRGKLTA